MGGWHRGYHRHPPWPVDGLLLGRRNTSDESWVEPIVGGGVVNLTPKVFVRGWAYIGGFGVASGLTADLFAGLGQRFTDSISALLAVGRRLASEVDVAA